MSGQVNSIATLLHLSPSNAFRSGVIIRLDRLIDRVIFAVKEFFRGGWGARDRREFEKFYGEIRGTIALLGQNLDAQQNLDQTILDLRNLTEVHARIANSFCVKSLKGSSGSSYSQFTKDLKELCAKAGGVNLYAWVNQVVDPRERAQIVRWIRATVPQRRFAAYLDHRAVPLRGDEVPAGSVIITHPQNYLLSLRLTGRRSLWKAIVVKIKSLLCLIFNGMPYTHAELALGNGEFFDLDKPNHGWCRGQGMIKQNKTSAGEHKVLYHAVIVKPNREAIVRAYNQSFPDQPLATFEEVFAKISDEARAAAPRIKANFFDVLKTGILIQRPPTYNCALAWQPGKKRYGCSATVSALFGKFGIDIGQQFNKVDQNIKPGDFLKSKFFESLY